MLAGTSFSAQYFFRYPRMIKPYIDDLITEAEELKRDFLAGAIYRWYRYSPNHPGYSSWKQRVLQVVRSLGDQNPYYTDLVAAEKNRSSKQPAEVFSLFRKTLVRVRQIIPDGTPWPAAEPTPTGPSTVCPQEPIIKNLAPEAPPPPVRECPAGKAYSPSSQVAAPRITEKKTNGDPPERPFHQLDLEARGVYTRLLSGVRDLISPPDNSAVKGYGEIADLCALSLETVRTNPALLSYAASVSTGDYLYAHTANVTIFSQAIALDYGVTREELLLLSFCAIMHDAGMADFRELYSKSGLLTDEEFSRITLHPEAGTARVALIPGLDPALKSRIELVIRQSHERIDSSGYPAKAAGDKIDPLAQIIGLADNYEAMTHPRSWRKSHHPCETVKLFISEGEKRFSLKVLKSFIRTISLYPPASLVELSSGEIARVVMLRKGALSRPLAEVLLNRDYEPVEPRLLDLNEHLVQYSIARPVPREELEARNPSVAGWLESFVQPTAPAVERPEGAICPPP